MACGDYFKWRRAKEYRESCMGLMGGVGVNLEGDSSVRFESSGRSSAQSEDDLARRGIPYEVLSGCSGR